MHREPEHDDHIEEDYVKIPDYPIYKHVRRYQIILFIVMVFMAVVGMRLLGDGCVAWLLMALLICAVGMLAALRAALRVRPGYYTLAW